MLTSDMTSSRRRNIFHEHRREIAREIIDGRLPPREAYRVVYRIVEHMESQGQFGLQIWDALAVRLSTQKPIKSWMNPQ